MYLAFFVLMALVVSRVLRSALDAAMARQGHVDRTTISFLQQITTAVSWVIMLILYAHLIPVLRSMGTALLAGASVASVVIGLAAQSTLGNLVAGIPININLNSTNVSGPISVSIRLSRDADLQAAQALAVAVAADHESPQSVVGCYVTKSVHRGALPPGICLRSLDPA